MEKELIKIELLKNIDAFVNEIDLTMELKMISNIQKYVTSIKNNEKLFLEFVEYTNSCLKEHQSKISSVLFSNKKVKSEYYTFLNDITLFNNLLKFNVFENESKNTKKDIIKYLYSIYMSVVFLSTTAVDDEQLDKQLLEFVAKIYDEAKTLKKEDIKVKKSHKTKKIDNNTNFNMPNNIPANMPTNMPDLSNFNNLPDLSNFNMPDLSNFNLDGNLGDIMQSILGNSDILSIATDISHKMQNQQMNPMDMLSSLMSGNIENTPLQGLVEEIQQKVETKINSGEINKEELETQAKTIIGSIESNSTAFDSMPGMGDFINNVLLKKT